MIRYLKRQICIRPRDVLIRKKASTRKARRDGLKFQSTFFTWTFGMKQVRAVRKQDNRVTLSRFPNTLKRRSWIPKALMKGRFSRTRRLKIRRILRSIISRVNTCLGRKSRINRNRHHKKTIRKSRFQRRRTPLTYHNNSNHTLSTQ